MAHEGIGRFLGDFGSRSDDVLERSREAESLTHDLARLPRSELQSRLGVLLPGRKTENNWHTTVLPLINQPINSRSSTLSPSVDRRQEAQLKLALAVGALGRVDFSLVSDAF